MGGLDGTIDCDIHPAIPAMATIVPYLDDYWREQVEVRGIDAVDLTSYPPTNPLSVRADWRPERGKAAMTLEQVRTQVLEPFGSSIAICNVLCGAQTSLNVDFAAAMCRAVNRWIVDEWLDRDERLRGSIVIPMQDPQAAAAEIEHWADDRRFVQVLMLVMGETPLGRRQLWPIYEAAEQHGLAIGIHAGSMYRHPPSWSGWPSFYIEEYAAYAQAFQGQLLSLVYEGVFQKFPKLRVVLLESGVTWLPSFLWRAAMTWRAVRMEVPWVDRSPIEIIRAHVRLTTQPFDAPPGADRLVEILDQIGSDDMLLFSTDYPHWQFDGSNALPAGLPEGLRQRVMRDNALATYPRLAEGAR